MRLQNKCLGTCAYLGGLPAVLESFAWSWGQMVQFNAESLCGPGEYVQYDRASLSLHSAARNGLADRAKGEWLLMLDADHQFEPDLVVRMVDRMNAADLDVLTGFYQYKQPPHSPVLYLAEGEGFAPLGSWRAADGSQPDLFPVAAAGAGCLMVRTRVFDRIRDELNEAPFDVLHPFGEDMSFFKRLQRLGVTPYCDARIACHHLQVRPVTPDDYDRGAVELNPEAPAAAFTLTPGSAR